MWLFFNRINSSKDTMTTVKYCVHTLSDIKANKATTTDILLWDFVSILVLRLHCSDETWFCWEEKPWEWQTCYFCYTTISSSSRSAEAKLSLFAHWSQMILICMRRVTLNESSSCLMPPSLRPGDRRCSTFWPPSACHHRCRIVSQLGGKRKTRMQRHTIKCVRQECLFFVWLLVCLELYEFNSSFSIF